jgi:Sec-independent protein translocase protein TatA
MVQTMWVMFGLSRAEFGLVLFIFVLVWGAGLLPPLAERIAVSWAARRGRASGQGR